MIERWAALTLLTFLQFFFSNLIIDWFNYQQLASTCIFIYSEAVAAQYLVQHVYSYYFCKSSSTVCNRLEFNIKDQRYNTKSLSKIVKRFEIRPIGSVSFRFQNAYYFELLATRINVIWSFWGSTFPNWTLNLSPAWMPHGEL